MNGLKALKDIVDVDNKFRQQQCCRAAPSRGLRGWEASMPGRKRSPKRTQSGTKAMPLRKSASARRASEPAIELGDLNERLGYFVRRLQVWIFQDFIRRLSSIDISPAQFSVLVVIGANTGLSQAELSATLAIERARLVRLLHRLEQRGLIQRLPSAADGRRHALQLTRDGQVLLARAKNLAAQHEAGLKQTLGAERYSLLLDNIRDV